MNRSISTVSTTAREVDCANDASLDAVERSLDPEDELAWEEFAEEARRILDDTLRQMRTLRKQQAWQPMPATTQAAIDEAPLPVGERSLGAVYAEIASRVLPFTSANRHPRAWGWVRGQGTPVAMVADMIASATNAHVGGGSSAPVHVEATVIRWLAEALGMREPGSPKGPTGLLTSGATMANMLGLAVARAAKAPFDVREEGLSSRPRMIVYASRETHGWAQKAMELLGHGRQSLHLIPVDNVGRLDLTLLEAEILCDRAAGHLPYAVIANAGTVNTGAIDDLPRLRALCDEEELWLHVDGAIGALLKIAPSYRELVAGLESADSVAFDLHKWMYLPFETGCLLVRDAAHHLATFASEAAYMEWADRGMLAGGISFSNLGIESSRGFKALRVWMQLSVYGLARHASLIEQNMAQSAFLEFLIRESTELRLLAPRTTNIVCFCYEPAGTALTQEQGNSLTRELLVRLQESGAFVVSGTTLNGGVFALRVSITNHRSRRCDFQALVDAVVKHGRAISAS